MENSNWQMDIKTEAAVVLGSLAKGPASVVQELVDAKVIPVLLQSNLLLIV